MITQKITPYLWVEKDAKAVADYYLSIFKDGKLKDLRKFDSDESGNDAGIETAVIEIAGMEVSILAAGPLFKFNEAVSFVINTKDQAETDRGEIATISGLCQDFVTSPDISKRK
jgi:predicted 3-demethylubiquinone-9 3-methyltransferase (glyoxalase superfamily)